MYVRVHCIIVNLVGYMSKRLYVAIRVISTLLFEVHEYIECLHPKSNM